MFVNVNPQSTLALGQARGTAICAAVLAGLPVAEYTALQVKQSVVGNGHADKEQVQHMVQAAARAAGRSGARRRRRARLRDLPCARRRGSAALRTRGLRMKKGQAGVIGRLTGKLAGKQPPQVLVDVGGVGLRGRRADEHLLQPAGDRRGGHAATRTSWCARTRTRSTASPRSRSARAFRQLIRISGVGARTALSVLSGLSVADLAQAVALQEAAPLTKIPGIGKKTAERLLLELKGKLAERDRPRGRQQASGRGERAARAWLQREGSARSR